MGVAALRDCTRQTVLSSNPSRAGQEDPSIENRFTVQNVVCTRELQRSLNLNAPSLGLGLEAVEYEPQQFQGLIYRPPGFPAVLLVFANGNVMITGVADVVTGEAAFEHLQTKGERSSR